MTNAGSLAAAAMTTCFFIMGASTALAQQSAPDFAAIKAKGEAYATSNGTKWKATVQKNELTNSEDVVVTSLQTNGKVGAEITGKCGRFGPTFEAVIIDQDGKGVDPEGNSDVALGRMRTDDDETQEAVYPRINNYTNDIRLLILVEKTRVQPNDLNYITTKFVTNTAGVDGVWRVLLEIGTRSGPLVIKIPVYDPAIQKLVASCRRQ